MQFERKPGELAGLFYCIPDILETMQVRVLYFGALREAAGTADELLTLGEGSTAAEVIAHLRAHLPQVAELLSRCAIAVNQNYVQPSEPLHEGDEVAVLPPVSGGHRESEY